MNDHDFRQAQPSSNRPLGSNGSNDAPPPMSVLELTIQLRDCVQHHFGRLRLKAEVGSFKGTKTGHCYLTLKEEDASIDAMIWSQDLRSLSYVPKVGDEVIVAGGLGTRPKSGQTTFYIRHVTPTGEGLMQQEFERTCTEFQAQGLFDRARPLPMIPKGVGLITSVNSSAYHDFMKSVNERAPGIPIYIADVTVQGANSLPSITRALRHMYQDPRVEVIALTRGGGSMEQLWDFNHRELCLFLARSPKPTVVGIGHEDNTLIAELVADVRGHTPTKVAEAIFPKTQELNRRLFATAQQLNGAITQIGMQRFNRLLSLTQNLSSLGSMDRRQQRLEERIHHFERAIDRQMQRSLQRLESLDLQLHRSSPQHRVERASGQLKQLVERMMSYQAFELPSSHVEGLERTLNSEIDRKLNEQRQRLSTLITQLDLLSPLKTLARGFSIVKRIDADKSEVIQRAVELKPGDHLELTLREGLVSAKVSDIISVTGINSSSSNDDSAP